MPGGKQIKASKGKPGRPPGKKDTKPRTRGATGVHRPPKTIDDLFKAAASYKKSGPIDVVNALADIKIMWSDLEAMALAFLSRGLELLPTVNKATDALLCADRIMAILERRTDMKKAADDVVQAHGISLRFSTAEELCLEIGKGANEEPQA